MTDAEMIAALHRLCETLKATAPHDRFLGVPIYDLTNEAATRLSVMREALDDAVATMAAIRATSVTDEWHEAAKHFRDVCGETLLKVRAALGER